LFLEVNKVFINQVRFFFATRHH